MSPNKYIHEMVDSVNIPFKPARCEPLPAPQTACGKTQHGIFALKIIHVDLTYMI